MISSAPGWLWRLWPWPLGRSTTAPEKRAAPLVSGLTVTASVPQSKPKASTFLR